MTTKKHKPITVSEAGRLGGKARTTAKARSSRKNGQLGGRPRKQVRP